MPATLVQSSFVLIHTCPDSFMHMLMCLSHRSPVPARLAFIHICLCLFLHLFEIVWLLFALLRSGVHGLASGQKPAQAKPNSLAWRWLWPGFGSQKPKPSQKAKTLVEYYLFTYFLSNWHIKKTFLNFVLGWQHKYRCMYYITFLRHIAR